MTARSTAAKKTTKKTTAKKSARQPAAKAAKKPTKESTASHTADSHELIRVLGARVNNLRDVNVEIPKRRLTASISAAAPASTWTGKSPTP